MPSHSEKPIFEFLLGDVMDGLVMFACSSDASEGQSS